MIAVRHAIKAAVFEDDLGVPSGLANMIHRDAGIAQHTKRMSERPAH